MPISFVKGQKLKKSYARPPPADGPPADAPKDGTDPLDAKVVASFFKTLSGAEAVIAEQNRVKRDLLAAYRKEHGPERIAALRLACARKLADPDKIAKHEAVTKEAATYLAMLNSPTGRLQ